MKTIEEAAHEYFRRSQLRLENSGSEAGFIAGVEFAQRWIPISEELPETKPNYYKRRISKNILFQTVKNVYLGYYDSELNEWYSGGELIKNIIKWKPIEYK